MVLAQPEDEFAFERLAILGIELSAAAGPPFADAVITDRSIRFEQGPRIGTANEVLATGAGADAEEAECVPQAIKFELMARKNFVRARLGFFRHSLVPAKDIENI